MQIGVPPEIPKSISKIQAILSLFFGGRRNVDFPNYIAEKIIAEVLKVNVLFPDVGTKIIGKELFL